MGTKQLQPKMCMLTLLEMKNYNVLLLITKAAMKLKLLPVRPMILQWLTQTRGLWTRVCYITESQVAPGHNGNNDWRRKPPIKFHWLH